MFFKSYAHKYFYPFKNCEHNFFILKMLKKGREMARLFPAENEPKTAENEPKTAENEPAFLVHILSPPIC